MVEMRKFFLTLASLVLMLPLSAQKPGDAAYIIGFYNVENFFDTSHDDGKNDYDFLPDGRYEWDGKKYGKKLSNIARVLKEVKRETGRYHTILGLAEVENENVLKDIVATAPARKAGYRYVHYESPDRRGIDVALLYRPDQFTLLDSEKIPFSFEDCRVSLTLDAKEQAEFRTRDILMVRGLLSGEQVAVYVAHLPSRIGGKGKDLRSVGADIIYRHSRQLTQKFPGIRIIVMGDMNDDPSDESMATWLHGKADISEVGHEDFFDPFCNVLADGTGSLAYKGAWNLFDIIMVNSALAHGADGGLRILPVDGGPYYGRVFNKPFLTQQKGEFKGTPFRTFSRGVFIGGYSDHYPTYIEIGKSQKK